MNFSYGKREFHFNLIKHTNATTCIVHDVVK